MNTTPALKKFRVTIIGRRYVKTIISGSSFDTYAISETQTLFKIMGPNKEQMFSIVLPCDSIIICEEVKPEKKSIKNTSKNSALTVVPIKAQHE